MNILGTRSFGVILAAALIAPVSSAAQTVLSVTPTSITVQAAQGTTPPAQTIAIGNEGNRSLKWSIDVPTAAWLAVSPTTGVQAGTVTVSFASGLPVGIHSASFTVTSENSSVTVNVQASILGGDVLPPPPSGDWIYCATEGGFCAFTGTKEVRYGANGVYFRKTLSGGTACTNSVFADPIPGTVKQCHIGTAAPTLAPTPSPTAVGPQSTITCPADAVDIWPGVSIQNIVDSYGGNTTFCLRAGTHSLRSSITPKTGNTFVGEYGAVLDGTGWTTSDGAYTQGAFRAHSQDIDYVTIRNLVIRNMPQRGIHAYWMPDHWTIENNEIAFNVHVGVTFGPYFLVRNNYIHHNTYSGYLGVYAHNATLENNEIAYNGQEQKTAESANVTVRNNFVHHNVGTGIWYDSNNTGALVEGNRIEDNGLMGIYYEISSDGIIRNNTIRRNGEAGVMLSVSKNTQIYNNTLEHNFRGITYFLLCPSVGGPTNFDLTNNTAHDNTITLSTRSGALASIFSYASCTSTQVAPYLNGSKNLTFSRNTYSVPSLSNWYWFWGDATKSWTAWQILGHDTTGTASQ